MPVPDLALVWLWRHMLLLDWRSVPWRLRVWDATAGIWRDLGGASSRSAVYFPGDPPAFVIIAGEFVEMEVRA